MARREGLSATLRWQVFARDNFRCRYCGVQAGTNGTVLQAEHVVSVADGGTNAIDNLVAACQRCNSGKHARSLEQAPASDDAVAFIRDQAATLQDQAAAIASQIEAERELRQEVVNLICAAYCKTSVNMTEESIRRMVLLTKDYGSVRVADWVEQAAGRRVVANQLPRYLYGIIRNIKNQRQRDEAG